MKTSASSFLTLDLDYFFMGYSDYFCKENPYNYMNKLINLGIPIHVFMEHNEVLNYMDDPYDIVYNVDFHSDIVHDPCLELNEGTWANFYQHSHEAIFQWNYPSLIECFTKGYGICDEYPDKWLKSLMPYKVVRRRQGITNIDYESLTSIGVSISPDWVDERILEFMDTFSIFNDIKDEVKEKCSFGKELFEE